MVITIIWKKRNNGFWESEILTPSTTINHGDVLRVYNKEETASYCRTSGIYEHIYYAIPDASGELYDVCTQSRMQELPYTEYAIPDAETAWAIIDKLNK